MTSTRVRTTRAAEFTLTQEQIDALGDELSQQIVAVDEEHFGPLDAADPAVPESDSLVMVVYNVQDESYYDCAVTTYTAGYFAPDFIESVGMNVIVIDAFDWANRTGEGRRLPPMKASSPTSSSTCCTTTATRASCRGSTRASRTSRRSSTATASADRT